MCAIVAAPRQTRPDECERYTHLRAKDIGATRQICLISCLRTTQALFIRRGAILDWSAETRPVAEVIRMPAQLAPPEFRSGSAHRLR
jgi:hypothetical protein